MFVLRELERSDIPTINQWRNDSDLIYFLGAPFRYINQEVDENWFADYMINRHNTVRCVITDQIDTRSILGLVSLTSIDFLNRVCNLHILIGNKQDRGKGVGTFAVAAILRHAFRNLNMHRVELEVLEYNKPAIKLYRNAGFVEEGRKRVVKYKNGKYYDMIIMSMLETEWEELNKND